ncbi:MAG: SpoIIE family protein phosphatase [Bacteroidota bacterium]
MSRIEELERQLNLKQVQINRLLGITQSINTNKPARELFEMYQSFLSYEMGIKKMALYIRSEGVWECASLIGIKEDGLKEVSDELFSKYRALDRLDDAEHPFLRHFDVVIPVSHKEQPLAYVFLGGFQEDDDMYDKVQFITAMTNVISVAIENKRLFKQQMRQERLRQEMKLASDMQLSMVPKELPSKNCYEFASIYKPHLSVGGDYFDFIEFGDGKITFCVGDISGKGLAAALMMANFQAIFHSLVHRREGLQQFVKDVNFALFQMTKGDRFITFFVAEYDTNTRQLTYVNCGHNPPILIQDGNCLQLNQGTTILGCFDKLPFMETGAVQIEEDATILVYTDGLTDIQDNDGNYLNIEFLEDFVTQNCGLSVADFNGKLMEMTEGFVGDEQDYPDDFTVLTCKLFPHRSMVSPC